MGPLYRKDKAHMAETEKTEKKECKRCHDKKPQKDFVKSKVAKSGYLGYCQECWSEMVSHKGGRKHKVKGNPGRKPGRPPGRPPGRKPGRPALNGHSRVVVQAANDALKAAAAGRKEKFLVKAGHNNRVAEFASEDKALRHAMVEKMKGREVTVWRSCEFEMVLRIVGG
jgi:hypothetical protein